MTNTGKYIWNEIHVRVRIHWQTPLGMTVMQQVWATLRGKLSNSVSEVHGTQDFGGYQVASYNLNFFIH